MKTAVKSYSELSAMQSSQSSTRIWATGFALFAMFFGAGNLVFPLFLGANAGSQISWVAIAFLVVGVGTPFLGLVATSLYEGCYWKFFGRLGRVPAFLIITFLMLVIGPFTAAPRTEIITYQSLLPFLPNYLSNTWVFSSLFCLVTFLAAARETRTIDVIGYWITPIKLTAFMSLIILGTTLMGDSSPLSVAESHKSILWESVTMGYGTMDMLGAFFFATTAVRAIAARVDQTLVGTERDQLITKRLLRACVLAGSLLALIYLGFMLAAHNHTETLKGLDPAQMLHAISSVVLGEFGSVFVGVCVTFACLATSIALADVTSTFLHEHVFRKHVSRFVCLCLVMVIMLLMTQLGFGGIMHYANPLLQIIYPSLIALCLINILHKKTGFKFVKVPVLVVLMVSAIMYIAT